MLVESGTESPSQRDDCEGGDRCGQERVRAQYREIKYADCSHTCEGDAPDLSVIDQIGGQEECGARKRGNHAGAVLPDFVDPDEVKAGNEAERAGSVQDRIEKGEVVHAQWDAQRSTRSRTIASINAGRYMSEAKKSLLAATLVRRNRRRIANIRKLNPSIAAETP